MADTKEASRKRLSFIRRVYRTATRPLRALNTWAKKKQKILRFGSLAKWARQRQEAAQSAAARAKFKALRFRYRKKIRWLETHKDGPAPSDGIGTFDGKPVAAWIVPWLEKSRAAGWRGYLVSGYRTPEYSQQLCYGICGAPRCPGRCAGTSSNHTQLGEGNGAVDVTDYYNFGVIQRRIGSPLINRLGSQDPVHFSTSGV